MLNLMPTSKNLKNKLYTSIKQDPMLFLVALPLFILVAFTLLYYTLFKIGHVLDSDGASQVLLAKELLAEKNFFITEWYYSTELSIVDIHLLIAPLLALTGNMLLSKSIANILSLFIMSVSFYLLMKSMKVKLKYSLLAITLLLTPFSYSMLDVHFTGAYYIIYLIVIALTLAGVNYIYNWDLSKRKAIIIYSVLLVLSLLMGLPGPRFLIMLYGPLLITEFILILAEFKKANSFNFKDFKLWKRGLVSLGLTISFAFGLVINKLYLSKIMLYVDLGNTDFIKAEALGSRLPLTFGMLLSSFGAILPVSLYSKGSFTVVSKFIFLILLILMSYRLLKKSLNLSAPRKTYVIFYWVSFITNTYLLIFTTVFLHERYHLVVLPLLFGIVPVYFDEIKNEVVSIVRTLALPLLIIAVISSQYYILFRVGVVHNINKPKLDVIETLKNNNLEFGYATFWNANVMTVLSNGDIEVANLHADIYKEPKPSTWLTPKSYYTKDYHPGKTFLVLTEQENSKANNKLLEKAKMLTKVHNYIIYTYDENPFDFEHFIKSK